MDRLKFDLLERRYAIYSTAKELIEYVAFVHDLEKSDTTKIRSFYITLDEARFYYSPEICGLLNDIQAACERLLQHVAKRGQISTNDAEAFGAMADTLAGDQAALRRFYASLPEKFEPALAFNQLKTPAPVERIFPRWRSRP